MSGILLLMMMLGLEVVMVELWFDVMGEVRWMIVFGMIFLFIDVFVGIYMLYVVFLVLYASMWWNGRVDWVMVDYFMVLVV